MPLARPPAWNTGDLHATASLMIDENAQWAYNVHVEDSTMRMPRGER
jgi:hypothetical protein